MFPASITAPGYLDGATGFTINGQSGAGWFVSSGGNINGDNKTALIVGARNANQVYVILRTIALA
jgi:hypothetical protein